MEVGLSFACPRQILCKKSVQMSTELLKKPLSVVHSFTVIVVIFDVTSVTQILSKSSLAFCSGFHIVRTTGLGEFLPSARWSPTSAIDKELHDSVGWSNSDFACSALVAVFDFCRLGGRYEMGLLKALRCVCRSSNVLAILGEWLWTDLCSRINIVNKLVKQ